MRTYLIGYPQNAAVIAQGLIKLYHGGLYTPENSALGQATDAIADGFSVLVRVANEKQIAIEMLTSFTPKPTPS